ncbi:hypothetical protein [Arthrobacter sp. Cr_A7]|uniref:hypothetical protein n=1 Tax=Arthrobacter sp. Cr_A7 TaxID=3031017 RepID=UPI0023D98E52|nr:hypothetical protein [Arthrobacter sp. Cr_A7]MDF2049293.1 hypothetical protein [Arthrobacter sp. Cr_A7]
MGKVAGRKKRIIGTTVALVAIGGGAAFAYWTATGTGSTSGTTGASSNFTVTASVAGAALTPGGDAQTATFTITNPGTGVQKVQTVVATVANSDGSAWTSVPGCSKDDFKVGTAVFTPEELAANQSLTGTVTLQMINRDADQNGCKGATVPLYFSAS